MAKQGVVLIQVVPCGNLDEVCRKAAGISPHRYAIFSLPHVVTGKTVKQLRDKLAQSYRNIGFEVKPDTHGSTTIKVKRT